MKKLILISLSLLFCFQSAIAVSSAPDKETPVNEFIQILARYENAMVKLWRTNDLLTEYNSNKELSRIMSEMEVLRDEHTGYKLTKTDRADLLRHFKSSEKSFKIDEKELKAGKPLEEIIDIYLDNNIFKPTVVTLDKYVFEFPGPYIVLGGDKKIEEGVEYLFLDDHSSPYILLYIKLYRPKSNYWGLATNAVRLERMKKEVDLAYRSVFSSFKYPVSKSTEINLDEIDFIASKEFEGEHDGIPFVGTARSFIYEQDYITFLMFGLNHDCLEDLWKVIERYYPDTL